MVAVMLAVIYVISTARCCLGFIAVCLAALVVRMLRAEFTTVL